ncbi:MAG TPA: GldG family protein [Candidatus Hydrogenedentes bacterium]|nr:GldG family protein [Candidatus Hydrogenedentota bacterium]HOL77182.1 GldG family protein [Candidatus Hydrogenedentota bacterium]HPO85879.1 GldG family protein [Candidatus Hydrogenedentota bacterium]
MTDPVGKLRSALGIGAIILLDVALNFLLLKQTPFVAPVVIPFALGLVLGVVWIVWTLVRFVQSAELEASAAGINAVLGSLFFFGICVATYGFVRHWDVGWDLTQEGRRELSPQTIQVLKTMDKSVEVYGLFVSAADSLVAVAEDKTRVFLERCRKYAPEHLRYEIVDPESDPLILKRLDIPRASPSGTVVVRCGDRKPRVIALTGVNPRLEERDFTNALIAVLRDAAPKVYFLSGHGEKDITDQDPEQGGSILRGLLLGESYEVKQLQFQPDSAHVPADCDLLVIYGQNRDLRPYDVAALEEYLERGGRLLVFLDIWAVQRLPDVRIVEQMRPWLEEKYGIRVGEDIVVSRSTGVEITLKPSFAAEDGESPYRGSYNDNHPITRGYTEILKLRGARSVSLVDKMPKDVTGEVLLRSTPDCWAEKDLAGVIQAGWRASRKDADEEEGALPLAVAVVRKSSRQTDDSGVAREARLVVVGSRDLATNRGLLSSGNLVMNIFAWLTESEELIGIRATRQEDNPIVLSPLQEQVIAWIASLALVHVVVLAGLVIYTVRRKYQ